MARATAAPPVTASEPPSVKSFWTSTMIRARRVMSASLGAARRGRRLEDRGDRRLAARQLPARSGQFRDGRRVPVACGLQGFGADHLALLHQPEEQAAVVAVVHGLVPDPDD